MSWSFHRVILIAREVRVMADDVDVLIGVYRIQTAIGLAIGLFAAAVVVYPFGKRGYIFAF